METIFNLMKKLFTEPRMALYEAREPESITAVVTIAFVGVLVNGLLAFTAPVSGVSFLTLYVIAVMISVLNLLLYAGYIFLGGRLTGGSGDFRSIFQMACLVSFPLGIASHFLNLLTGGLGGTALRWIILYYMILIGHNFSGFNDVALAAAVGVFFSLLGGFFIRWLSAAILLQIAGPPQTVGMF